jgi:hypothetical protein
VIVPMPKRADSPATSSRIPFHEMLKTINAQDQEASRITGSRKPDSFEPSANVDAQTKLAPNLGEILPVPKITAAPIQIQQAYQQQNPATGQLLDLYL